MGLVKKDEKKQEEKKHEEKKEAPEAPEDPPIVKKLKEIDDKYLELEKEYEREVQRLLVQYTEKQKPFLEERKQVLAATEGDGPGTGTPALRGFWLKAMKNHPAFEDVIQEWDDPVLEFLADIEKSHVDDGDSNKGFTLVFRFVENPYFTNTELSKEYRTEVSNPYCGEIDVKEVKSSKIEWKAGKDVTVEKVAKKVKGGGAKKAKQKKEKEEPRPSFFRDFFRNLHPEMELVEDARDQARMLADEEGEEEDDDDDEALVAYLMESDHETGTALRDHIIPFAVRWYTGEAAPDDDEDDDDDEDEDDEEEEEDDDDDESDEPPAKGSRGKPKPTPKKKGGESKPKSSPEMKPSEAPKEECKQQ